MEDYIEFLKDIPNVWVNRPYPCGDGCCMFDNWDTENVSKGESIYFWNVDVKELTEGEDYKWTTEEVFAPIVSVQSVNS
jgi:hypothetical protein